MNQQDKVSGELGRLKGGRSISLGVALKRAYGVSSKLSVCSIRALLLADVLADLLQLEANSGNGIAPSPEMLAREIPLLAAQPGNCDRTLPFEKPDNGSDRVFGRNGNAHMHMVRHEMPFENLAFLLPRQCMEDRSQLLTGLPEDGFPSALGHKHYVVLAVPFDLATFCTPLPHD